MYSERTVLPLITHIKAIFDQEIVDFAILNRQGFRYSYADFIIKNGLKVAQKAYELESQQQKHTIFLLADYETHLFYDQDDLFVCVILEKPLKATITPDDIHRRLSALSFFQGHIDIDMTESQEHEYGMVILDFDETVQVMNHYAKRLFDTDVHTLGDFANVIINAEVFEKRVRACVKSERNDSFYVNTVKRQHLRVYSVIDSHSQMIQLVFSHQPVASFYNHVIDSFDYLRLGIVHVEFLYDDEKQPFDARVLYTNERYGKMMQEDIHHMIGKHLYEIYPNYPQERFQRYSHVARGNRAAFQDYNRRLDKHFHVYSYSPKRGEVINVYYETTHYHRMKTNERIQLKKIQMMLSLAEMGFFEIDLEHKTFSGDAYVKNIFGVDKLDYSTYRKLFKAYLHPDDQAYIYEKNAQLLSGEISEGSSLFRLRKHTDDDPQYVEYYMQVLDRHNDGSAKRILGLLRDVTKEQEKNLKIEHMANHDALTNLHNRHNLKRHLSHETLPLKGKIVVFDLDGLKSVNDILGHYEGDEVIRRFATMLKTEFPEDYLARTGGDEFLMITEKTSRAIKTHEKRLQSRLESMLDYQLPLSVSVGVAELGPNGDFRLAYEAAEEKMYRQKLMDRPQRKRDTLALLQRQLFRFEPALKARVERLKPIARDFMIVLGMSRTGDMQTMETLIEYHALGRIEAYIASKRRKSTFDLKDCHAYINVELGFKILSNLLEDPLISRAVLYQCEHVDGSGHPHGLKGEDIPFMSRILAIVARFDRLTRAKAYGKTMSKEKALEKLSREAGKYFDSDMVDAFVRMM